MCLCRIRIPVEDAPGLLLEILFPILFQTTASRSEPAEVSWGEGLLAFAADESTEGRHFVTFASGRPVSRPRLFDRVDVCSRS
jgi:hypothetical protein